MILEKRADRRRTDDLNGKLQCDVGIRIYIVDSLFHGSAQAYT
jgi:hypothetical protein